MFIYLFYFIKHNYNKMKNLIIEPYINKINKTKNKLNGEEQMAFFLVDYINKNYLILEKLFNKSLKTKKIECRKEEIFKLLAVIIIFNY